MGTRTSTPFTRTTSQQKGGSMLPSIPVLLLSQVLWNCVKTESSPHGCITRNGHRCIFPFFYQGKQYQSCIKLGPTHNWCPTSKKKTALMNDELHGYGQWGICTSSCQDLYKSKGCGAPKRFKCSSISGMNAGGELQNKSYDQCSQLCCKNPKCKSFDYRRKKGYNC